jgi:hypothetical protein
MDIAELEKRYLAAKQSDDDDVHDAFAEELVASNDPDVIRYHYGLLADRENHALYQRVRAAFEDRGKTGQAFLVEQAKHEQDPRLHADILHLLGIMGSPAALDMARQDVNASEPEIRRRAAYVLGWLAGPADIELLKGLLLRDASPEVRATAATALIQVWYRLPQTKNALLTILKNALESEKIDDVMTWIIIAAQEIMKKRFGLRENIDERKVTGDPAEAKVRCLRAMARLRLA